MRVPADGVMDGMKHWDPWVRPHIQKAKGKVTGSYWYSTPMVAVAGHELEFVDFCGTTNCKSAVNFYCGRLRGGLLEETLFLALHHDEVQAADADALEGGS